MTLAAKLIDQVHAAGGEMKLRDGHFKLIVTKPMPGSLVAALRENKAAIIVELGCCPEVLKAEWIPDDWQVFFDERVGIAEFDGGQTRDKAESLAFEACITEWLNRHLKRTDPGLCAWCNKPDHVGHAIVPFWADPHEHTWLHPECWNAWYQNRRAQAENALTAPGLIKPTV